MGFVALEEATHTQTHTRLLNPSVLLFEQREASTFLFHNLRAAASELDLFNSEDVQYLWLGLATVRVQSVNVYALNASWE